ncbi:serine/threonine protein phosphatase [Thermus scotoductus SA-01]|uniref:Serine/threonine protein phosphatase n=1 Tax=Thermus scotoductus (strain ATCC 700910 / SA-01) TaxID=743525 RepID=E8PPY4_THESS|nr:serine/threonine protein phosphatase [Thermus scotoductus SA-01]
MVQRLVLVGPEDLHRTLLFLSPHPQPLPQVLEVLRRSVDEPMDGDPRASFVLYEEGRAQLYRVQYDLQGLLGALEGLPLGKEQRAELRRLYERAG